MKAVNTVFLKFFGQRPLSILPRYRPPFHMPLIAQVAETLKYTQMWSEFALAICKLYWVKKYNILWLFL